MLASIPDEGYAGCCEAFETLDIGAALGRVSAPTLVISGSHDGGATPDVVRVLADSIPGARYAEVAGAHLANVERPGEVAALLSDHFG